MALRDSPRFGLPYKGGTPESIGPNAYLICNPDDRKNKVPFLSSSERDSFPTKFYTDAIYDPIQDRSIKGGTSIHYTDKRFKYKYNEFPGPGYYDPKKTPKKSPRVDPTPVPGKGKLYMCEVPLNWGDPSPSIPTKIDENGYWNGSDGRLQKVPPDTYDQTLGPAFYNVDTGPCIGTKLYKGCKWSTWTSTRSFQTISEGPSPFTYSPKYDVCTKNEDDEFFRQMCRKRAYLPRYLEQQEALIKKEGQPGPGHYHLPPPDLTPKMCDSIYPKPFISASARFKITKTEHVKSSFTYEEPKKLPVSKLNVPFGINTDRSNLYKIPDSPGPGAYELKGQIQTRLDRKLHRYTSVYVPFDSNSKRPLSFVSPDAMHVPGPDQYGLDQSPVRKKVDASVFKSTTCRFPRKKPMSNVEPASYNSTEVFKKMVTPTSHNKKKIPFNAKQPKCIQKFNNNPAPGFYYKPEPKTLKGFTFRITPKDDIVDNGVPGSNTYKFHPSVCAMSKAIGTHNLRMKENLIRVTLRLPPWATKGLWNKERMKNKKLRWFASNGQLVHCNYPEDTFGGKLARTYM